MLWLPTLSELVLKLAVVTPMLVLRAPLLIRVVPSKKLTVPLGEATTVLPGETTLTVAVKVVDWPNRVGLTEDVSAVMVSALLTTWVRATEVEGLKLVSLLYVLGRGGFWGGEFGPPAIGGGQVVATCAQRAGAEAGLGHPTAVGRQRPRPQRVQALGEGHAAGRIGDRRAAGRVDGNGGGEGHRLARHRGVGRAGERWGCGCRIEIRRASGGERV